jgi:hypothetical protein
MPYCLRMWICLIPMDCRDAIDLGRYRYGRAIHGSAVTISLGYYLLISGYDVLSTPRLMFLRGPINRASLAISYVVRRWHVRRDDPRRSDAYTCIHEAIRRLEMARTERLDHTSQSVVATSLEGLSIVQRSLGAPMLPDEKRIVARLHQVASAIKTCTEPSAVSAYTFIETAEDIFQSMAGECNVS